MAQNFLSWLVSIRNAHLEKVVEIWGNLALVKWFLNLTKSFLVLTLAQSKVLFKLSLAGIYSK